MFDNIRADIRELQREESGTLAKVGIILLHPGFHAVLLYRAARWLHLHHLRPFAVLTSYFNAVLTGAQISARAAVGRGLVIYHPHGTVVGATAVIGDNCTLTHGNVIGQLLGGGDRPVIGNHFVAATGAKILGRIRIGDKVRVGPNAVVTQSLADGLTVAGNPARIVRSRELPDATPVAQTASPVASAGPDSAVLRRLVDVIAGSAAVTTPGNAIGKSTVLLGEGFGLDSLEMLHVISAVEEEFGLTIDEGTLNLSHLQTVGAFAAFISEQLVR